MCEEFKHDPMQADTSTDFGKTWLRSVLWHIDNNIEFPVGRNQSDKEIGTDSGVGAPRLLSIPSRCLNTLSTLSQSGLPMSHVQVLADGTRYIYPTVVLSLSNSKAGPYPYRSTLTLPRRSLNPTRSELQ